MAVCATLGVHLLCLILVALPTLYLKFSGIDAYRRGFFCNDESISYPYKSNTIPFYVVGIVGIGIPCIFIIINEVLLNKSNPSARQRKLDNPILVSIYIFMGIFVFGVLFDQAITQTVKYLIGRLRPHFLNACKPTTEFWNNNCKNVVTYINRYVYINDTDCQETDKSIIQNMRRSFPSGHSSCSAYCAIAFSIYLYLRWKPQIPGISIIRAFIQAVSIILAIFCAASRVSDYKHHPTDVIAGFISGSIVAISSWLIIIKSEPNICAVKTVNEEEPYDANADDIEMNVQ